ncbi:hypothetical protein DdX_02425 [Ditylenchus destructor]|uniref:Uncharacterized protein n=1 Tax=Ditylenchus destructor TaxID=166010 RepID=A0AAD4RC87_9BILA|nr:hypothetical protein DdX_02425 [Ditylenchus destructor]
MISSKISRQSSNAVSNDVVDDIEKSLVNPVRKRSMTDNTRRAIAVTQSPGAGALRTSIPSQRVMSTTTAQKDEPIFKATSALQEKEETISELKEQKLQTMKESGTHLLSRAHLRAVQRFDSNQTAGNGMDNGIIMSSVCVHSLTEYQKSGIIFPIERLPARCSANTYSYIALAMSVGPCQPLYWSGRLFRCS